MHRGFAKLYRKFLDWEWYDDIPCKVLYLHCLLQANHKDKEYRGNLVKRGSFLTSFDKLSKETGLSVKQVRTAQSKLEPKYLASKRTKLGQTVFVIDFKTYNGDPEDTGKQAGKAATNEGQDKGKIRATTKNVKNEENVKNEKKYTARDARLVCEKFDFLDNDIWNEWIDFKQRKKHPITERAINGNINKLKKLGIDDANKIIEKSLEEEWKGLFPLEDDKPNNMTMEQHGQEWLQYAED